MADFPTRGWDRATESLRPALPRNPDLDTAASGPPARARSTTCDTISASQTAFPHRDVTTVTPASCLAGRSRGSKPAIALYLLRSVSSPFLIPLLSSSPAFFSLSLLRPFLTSFSLQLSPRPFPLFQTHLFSSGRKLSTISHSTPLTLPSSRLFSMDFEHAKPTYLDSMDNSSPFYMDNSLDYLQYPPHSPTFGVSIGLPGTPSPSIGFNTLNLSSGLGDYTYSSPSFSGASPARPYTPPDGASISPPSIAYNLSGGELSSDGMASGRHSRGSGTHSPPASIPYAATVPRSHRFNPIAAPASRTSARGAHRRRGSRSNDDSDEEDDDFQPIANMSAGGADSRRETIRKQRIESEQRRRDELRDGYARLKDTLPASNQKSSKVSLLDRATSHLRYLETVKDQLEMRLKSAESEVHRLRNVNEALMLGTATQRHAAASGSAMVSTSSF